MVLTPDSDGCALLLLLLLLLPLLLLLLLVRLLGHLRLLFERLEEDKDNDKNIVLTISVHGRQ